MVTAVATWVATKAAAFATAAGVPAGVAKVVYVAAYYGTHVAISAAAGAAARSMAGTPDSETAKGSLKQAIPPRIKAYGRRRMGGSYMLWEARRNAAYDVVALPTGRAEAIEQVWMHDHVVTLSPTGWVQGSPDYGGGNNNLIHVAWRLGAATETAYPAIVAALGGEGVWTNDHRGDGIASLGCDYHHAKKENLLADYPNGDPLWSVTGRWTPVWDPRNPAQTRASDHNWTASGNLALQILDFCCSAEGMGLDYATQIAPALDHWKGEADICDEPIALKGGGTEPRYWGSGYYALPDEPQSALDKMLAACDGKLLADEFGVVRLWVGKVRAPTVWLTDEDIADYDVQCDAAAFDVVNELVPSFVSEAHGWTMKDAQSWRDEGDILLRGRALTAPLPLEWVNSASLARRIVKRELSRQLTPVRGTLIGRLSCARALGQRWVRLDLADLELSGAVAELETGGKVSFARAAVDMPFSLVADDVDAWDPETEEDGSGVPPPRPGAGELTTPSILGAEAFFVETGSGFGARLRLTLPSEDRPDLSWLTRWRKTGEAWLQSDAQDMDTGAAVVLETGFVPASTTLEVQVAYVTGGGLQSAWGPTTPMEVEVPAYEQPAAQKPLSRSVPYPTSATADTITIVAFDAAMPDGSVINIPAGSITGLSALTNYGVFWRASSGFEAEETPATGHMSSGSWIFIGWQATADGGGAFPSNPTPPGGWGGSGESGVTM